MATYIENLTLPFARTGVTGQYPMLVKSTTYTPDCTLFVKAGDTVRYVVTQDDGSGSTGTIGYANTTASDTDPDPTVTTSQSSPATWERTVGTSTEDRYFDWYFFGSVDFEFGSGKKYSQKLRTIRVDGAPRMNGGTSAITVAQGGTITFSVTGLSMFDESANAQLTAGTNSNKLNFSVFNSNGSLVGVHNYTGGGWDSSNNQLGKVHTGDTSTVLTIGSNFPTGTYSVYLTHVNVADSPTTNDFYGTENRLGANGLTGTSASALQFTVSDDDTDPTQFSLGADQTGLEQSQEYVTDTFTIAGLGSGVTATAVTSGTGNPQISVGTGNPVSFGDFTTNDVGVVNGNQIRFKMLASSDYDGQHTGTLTIGGTINDSLVLTTRSDPGGSSGGASGTQTYGVAVLSPPDNSNNQVTTFGPNFKLTNLIDKGSAIIPARSGATPGTLTLPASGTFEGVTSTNQADIDMMVLTAINPFVAYNYQMTRGNGTFTFTNYTYLQIPIDYYLLRIS